MRGAGAQQGCCCCCCCGAIRGRCQLNCSSHAPRSKLVCDCPVTTSVLVMQVLNHCYELLAVCVRGAEDVSPEMKVCASHSVMLWCLACLLNEPLLGVYERRHAVQGPCRSTAASRACCSMRKRSCREPARRDHHMMCFHHRLRIQLLLHSLLRPPRYDASLLCTPPPQEVYDQLQGTLPGRDAYQPLLVQLLSVLLPAAGSLRPAAGRQECAAQAAGQAGEHTAARVLRSTGSCPFLCAALRSTLCWPVLSLAPVGLVCRQHHSVEGCAVTRRSSLTSPLPFRLPLDR